MVTYLYRIYQVKQKNEEFPDIDDSGKFTGLFSSYSKVFNEEITEDIYCCEDREQFKSYIRDIWGNDIPFRASKKLESGKYYCVIIGECWNPEDHFNLVEYNCAYCDSKVKTRHYRPIKVDNWTIKNSLYGIDDYKEKHFCCSKCLYEYIEREKNKLKLERCDDVNTELWVSQSMFANNDIIGYIYRITKKSTGEFYIGQTCHIPIFRWGQHLKTSRFPEDKIDDYAFEVLEIVPKGKNLLEVEKEYIQESYKKNPSKSLNIINTKNVDYHQKLWEESPVNLKNNC